MYYLNVFNQLSLLTVLCFSFLILMYTLCLNKDRSQLNTLGITFLIPFLLSAASFLSTKDTAAYSLSILADLMILICFSVLLLTRPGSNMVSLIRCAIIIIPVLLIIAVAALKELPGYITSFNIRILFIMAPGLVIMYVLRREKGVKSLLFWAVLCLMGEFALKEFGQQSIASFLSICLKLAAYIMIFYYFHRENYNAIMSKVNEAEKKIAAVDKTLALEVKKRVFEIERSNEKLVNISKTDALTKAYNKAAILDIISSLAEVRPQKEFSILMFDIDNFKVINDTMGHIEGDKCIRRLALIAGNSIREIDFLGRYGGDEFIIVLPETSASQAVFIAEGFRMKVAGTESPHFTVSIGVAHFPNDALSVKGLIAAADEEMYNSKNKGRNAVSYKT